MYREGQPGILLRFPQSPSLTLSYTYFPSPSVATPDRTNGGERASGGIRPIQQRYDGQNNHGKRLQALIKEFQPREPKNPEPAHRHLKQNQLTPGSRKGPACDFHLSLYIYRHTFFYLS